MKCFKCGADLPDGAKFCKGCGAPQQPVQPQQTVQPPKSDHTALIVTIIITILLAALGTAAYFIFADGSDDDSSSGKKKNTSSVSSEDSSDDEESEPEKPVTTTTTTTTTTAPPRAAVDLTKYGVHMFNGHYYKAFANPDGFNFYSSSNACEKMGGELVSIASDSEQKFVEDLFSGKKNYWIGLVRDGNSWRWLDGTEYSYFHWDSFIDDNGDEQRQPDNYENSENTVRIAGTDQQFEYWRCNRGGWLDTNENGDSDAPLNSIGFICEWDHEPTPDEVNMYK